MSIERRRHDGPPGVAPAKSSVLLIYLISPKIISSWVRKSQRPVWKKASLKMQILRKGKYAPPVLRIMV